MTLIVALEYAWLKMVESEHLRDRYTVLQLFLVCPDLVLLQSTSDKAVPVLISQRPVSIRPLASDSPVSKKVYIEYSSVDRGDPNALLLRPLPARVAETKKGTEHWVGVILFGPGGRIGRRDICDQIRGLGKGIHEIGLRG